jgi:F-type H+-transporting ATPase subunit a
MLIASTDPIVHVLDTYSWHISEALGLEFHLPITKYTVLLFVAAIILVLLYVPIGRKARNGDAPRGPLWNALESVLTFIRDNVAKPYLGHDTDRFVPYLWTVFLFILTCNLLGLVPFLGSPTADISVTAGLAVIAFGVIHISAMVKLGVAGYLKSYVPPLELPFGLGYFVIPLIVGIEALGNFIKAFVLAVRLFANIFAGHVVLAVILGFIVMAGQGDVSDLIFWPITVTSVLGVVALSLLELFVAFLQAYVFTFLTALFLGAQLHPEH